MKNLISRFIREEEGQDLVEYALLLAFIALVVIGAVTQLGTTVQNKYTQMDSTLAS